MSYDVTSLTVFDGEVVASAQDGDYLCLGTNKGEVIRYTIDGGAVATLARLSGAVASMAVYSGLLYVGLAGGQLVSVATT